MSQHGSKYLGRHGGGRSWAVEPSIEEIGGLLDLAGGEDQTAQAIRLDAALWARCGATQRVGGRR